MAQKLDGNVAITTGASAGIGGARALAREGNGNLEALTQSRDGEMTATTKHFQGHAVILPTPIVNIKDQAQHFA